MDELKVFTGNAHPDLAQAVVDYLGIPLETLSTTIFGPLGNFSTCPRIYLKSY